MPVARRRCRRPPCGCRWPGCHARASALRKASARQRGQGVVPAGIVAAHGHDGRVAADAHDERRQGVEHLGPQRGTARREDDRLLMRRVAVGRVAGRRAVVDARGQPALGGGQEARAIIAGRDDLFAEPGVPASHDGARATQHQGELARARARREVLAFGLEHEQRQAPCPRTPPASAGWGGPRNRPCRRRRRTPAPGARACRRESRSRSRTGRRSACPAGSARCRRRPATGRRRTRGQRWRAKRTRGVDRLSWSRRFCERCRKLPRAKPS